MTADRGDVIVATDPFKDEDTTGRPFLILNRTKTPFHGEQYNHVFTHDANVA